METQIFSQMTRSNSPPPKPTQPKFRVLERHFSDPGKDGLPEKSPEEETHVPNIHNTELSLCVPNPVECHLPTGRRGGAEPVNVLEGGAPNVEETTEDQKPWNQR